ncbi:hypothetical protein [Geobacillus thermoleovorans]|uniref:hypothetical protein n=1 Tax=Geobacillus thermoleovorans TaxID=33941 RepID=UPI0018D29E82|nr:hypothetical protein [Geobacillus thermoleovorans]
MQQYAGGALRPEERDVRRAALANTLLEVETLDAEQIKHLFEHGTLPKDRNGREESGKSDGDVKINIQKKEE